MKFQVLYNYFIIVHFSIRRKRVHSSCLSVDWSPGNVRWRVCVCVCVCVCVNKNRDKNKLIWVSLLLEQVLFPKKLVTCEGVRIGHQRSIPQRLRLSKQGWIMAHRYEPNSIRESLNSEKKVSGNFRVGRIRVKNHCWLLVTLKPSGGTAWEAVMYARLSFFTIAHHLTHAQDGGDWIKLAVLWNL